MELFDKLLIIISIISTILLYYVMNNKKIKKIYNCIDKLSSNECLNSFNNGDCINYPGYYLSQCPKTCNLCHLLDPSIRCTSKFLNISNNPSYQPYELTKVLSNITTRYKRKYNIEIHHKDPYIITIDNFVNDIEIDALLNLITTWERSEDNGKVINEFGEKATVTSDGRTSHTAWCYEDCQQDPNINALYERIEDVILLNRSNFETLQALKYETNERYIRHHDMSMIDNVLVCGPRILTFFLYLSDVTSGGETYFSDLNISVTPKKGRALIWPSVYDNYTIKERHNDEVLDYQRDIRTYHEAKPVIQGVKYAANIWVRAYNFAQSSHWGCTGSNY